ncbi:uncharacterized protein RCC_05051 [Ramularia collo-cygni]|uniref:Protein kinase domain-containing protein n=1 Tax=Ramularia collo-cygni TaxID=112498 RepID=A0A2D3UXY2_9PEZI|nr:uncharacterized protein RCC_05051 [Ramularia collo-cygni]CZT19205.1 uncharacterized protein RCC_05051 [Ramularia collo-cygni]
MDSDDSSKCQLPIVIYWQPDGVRQNIAASFQNYVGRMEDGRTVLKYPLINTEEALQCLRAEGDRYVRLGTHENLVTYKGFNGSGLLLEYCEQGGLHDVLGGGSLELTDSQKATIGQQIVRCLIHLHDHNFIHCDIHARNVFLTSGLVAKIGDLQGQLSRPDGTIEMETMSQENAKSRHPLAGKDEFSWRTDIFALGTLLYHLWHGHLPFPELDEFDDEDLIQARYRTGQYPIDMTSVTDIDRVIGKCWSSRYESMREVLNDMQDLSLG